MFIHVAEDGETLATIAQKYKISRGKIKRENNIFETEIVPGFALAIAEDSRVHIIRDGENFNSVAMAHNLSCDELIKANLNLNSNLNSQNNINNILSSGDVVYLPERIKQRKIIHGFAYTNANREILKHADSSVISVFGRRILPDGNLSQIEDNKILSAIKDSGASANLVIANINQEGKFDNEIAANILGDNYNCLIARENFINSCVNIIREKNYNGIVLQFESVSPELSAKFADFAGELKNNLRGLPVTACITPRIYYAGGLLSDDDFDLKSLGENCDYIILNAYIRHSGPICAPAPLNWVKKSLEQTLNFIPANKILLGLPDFAMDWENNENDENLNNNYPEFLFGSEAHDLALRQKSRIYFDREFGSSYFMYNKNNRERIVWFEDSRSKLEKLRLASKYNLAGISKKSDFALMSDRILQNSLFETVRF